MEDRWFGSPPPIDEINSIGAGDAFNAEFITAWLDDCSLRECLQLGHRCGSVAMGLHGGASGIPDIDPTLTGKVTQNK